MNQNYIQYFTTSNGKWCIGTGLTVVGILSGRKIYHLTRFQQLQQQVHTIDKSIALMIQTQESFIRETRNNQQFLIQELQRIDTKYDQKIDNLSKDLNSNINRQFDKLDNMHNKLQ